jgi:hypothetical protein
MENPRIKTRVVHSQSKSAWNVVGETLGGKYKIARVPYITIASEEISSRQRLEAFKHASFISYCFNHSDDICKTYADAKDDTKETKEECDHQWKWSVSARTKYCVKCGYTTGGN